ncbi:LuxR C-terminal-related transcriptional regulator [Merismopedia glauca]|uniref:Helix-turn-helix transcriptional regulator n=1 Tax=Merismopedia glauca CCAP 1448/3 TaxID=1296344 RepID=A0A2T1C0I3_9CYAN|nr:LuxR C-terminal-related transcriptional regulator [Merismopedia glauca]PSB01678.1 helix-turn-helix transcriptional regulator [Merismopedia glauca CCAP 1448/3]
MSSSLQSLFLAIAQARNEQEVRSRIMVDVGAYFQANRWGLFFSDRDPGKTTAIKKSLQLALSVEYNPVLRYLVEHHAPIHEASLLPPGAWQKICPRFDHGHVMVGPIVNHGHLVGGVGLTRTQANSAFNERDLSDLGALCLHLSTWLAINQSKPAKILDSPILTPRELQIAELVAQGLTNESIGKSLWISENSVKQALKRIFRKREIASRVELVGKLSPTVSSK